MAKFKTELNYYEDDMWGEDIKYNKISVGAHFPSIAELRSMSCEKLVLLSIEKWKYLIKRLKKTELEIEDGGIQTCALCLVYFGGACQGCPINKITNFMGCENTPYEDYEADPCVTVAERELEFLSEDVLKKAKELDGNNAK